MTSKKACVVSAWRGSEVREKLSYEIRNHS
jgi:hypothetical protein